MTHSTGGKRSDERARITPTVDSEGAAEILHVHVEPVEQLARQGKLPGFKPGRKWIFPVDALMHWMTAEAEKNRLLIRRRLTPSR